MNFGIVGGRGLRAMAGAASLACLLCMAPAAHASWLSGNDLFTQCAQQQVPADKSGCLAYIMGTVDDAEVWGHPLSIPPSVTGGQLRDIVMDYLDKHPERRHWPGSALVWNAVREAYPPPPPPPVKKRRRKAR